VQHSGRPQVLHIRDAAGDLGRDVDTGKRLADDRVTARVLELRVRLGAHLGVALRREVAETHAPAVVGDDVAILRVQSLGRDAELCRCTLDQQFAHLRRGTADGRAAVLHRIAARGVALVRRAARIGGDEHDACRRDAELFGGERRQRGPDTLAKLGLAGEHGDAAVGAHANPRVEERRLFEASGKLGAASLLLCDALQWGERERDDQRTGARKERASADVADARVHVGVLRNGVAAVGTRCAARLIARRMRM